MKTLTATFQDEECSEYLELKKELLNVSLKLTSIEPHYLWGEHVQDLGLLQRGLKFLLGEVGYDLDKLKK